MVYHGLTAVDVVLTDPVLDHCVDREDDRDGTIDLVPRLDDVGLLVTEYTSVGLDSIVGLAVLVGVESAEDSSRLPRTCGEGEEDGGISAGVS